MFISVLDLFKIGIGPSSSHTLGPMIAAGDFINRVKGRKFGTASLQGAYVLCILTGSLAFTGKGHCTDHAVSLGMHGYLPSMLTDRDITDLVSQIWNSEHIRLDETTRLGFKPDKHIVFDKGQTLPEHPNGMIFSLVDRYGKTVFSQTFFSIGGGFVCSAEEIAQLQAPIKMQSSQSCSYPFESANAMLKMAYDNDISISRMKEVNEVQYRSEQELFEGMDEIWHSMQTCIERGLQTEGTLPGGLGISRRAKHLHDDLTENPGNASVNDWLCAYAMAVNEENAAGHMVVTAPTNGAAGVIPAVIYYLVTHEDGSPEQVRDFLLTASAIGGLIKHRSSISGAEVGCQGEVGSAAAMAAAGLCSARGGTPGQIENATEIALEHHLGMTCDPVKGLVQVPCIERNGFGAIKAYTAASLALRGNGNHYMPLDSCIEAMKQTGLEMSHKYKETSLGGLAVSITEC